jgi:hypothetical protein
MVMLLGLTQAVSPSILLEHTLTPEADLMMDMSNADKAGGKMVPQLMAKSHLFVSAQQTVPPAQDWVIPGIKSPERHVLNLSLATHKRVPSGSPAHGGGSKASQALEVMQLFEAGQQTVPGPQN